MESNSQPGPQVHSSKANGPEQEGEDASQVEVHPSPCYVAGVDVKLSLLEWLGGFTQSLG